MRQHPVRLLSLFLLFIGVISYAVWIGRLGGHKLSFETLDQDPNTPGSTLASAPQILVIANPHDVEAIASILGIDLQDSSYQSFINTLHGIDYEQFVVVLAAQEQSGPYSGITVQHVAYLANQVTVQAQLFRYSGDGPAVVTDPYHLIAVRKDGLHGPNIHFKLTNGWFVVADTTHDVP